MSDHATSGSRTEHRRPRPWPFRSGVGALQRALAVATAVLLGIDVPPRLVGHQRVVGPPASSRP
jgi:hypothetical protein